MCNLTPATGLPVSLLRFGACIFPLVVVCLTAPAVVVKARTTGVCGVDKVSTFNLIDLAIPGWRRSYAEVSRDLISV